MAGQISWVVEGMRCQCVYEACVFGVLAGVGVGEFLVSDLSTDGLILCISEAQNSNIFTKIINILKFSPTTSDSIPACSRKHGSVVAFLPFVMAFHSSFAWQSDQIGQE